MDNLSVIGSVAGILTSSSFMPQAVKTIKDKNTKSISLISYTIFTLSLISWATYGFLTKDAPLIITNLITLIPALIIFAFKLKYK